MTILNIKIRFFFHCLRRQIKSLLLRLECYFNSSWYFIDSASICTSGNLLKLNRLFTYLENDFVDIVCVTNVHIERGYLYCSLFFFSQNKIITVCHTLQKDAYIFWRLINKEEYDELISRRLWYEVTKDEELLDTIIKVLRTWKHDVIADHFTTYAKIGDEQVIFRLRERQRVSDIKTSYGGRQYESTGEFVFVIDIGAYTRKEVKDGHEPIETKISTIIAMLELEGIRMREKRIAS